MKEITRFLIIVICYKTCSALDGHELKSEEQSDDALSYSYPKEMRYLLYDVNPGEGFNLRRDVYMRIANMVRMLIKEGDPWTIVLPPWGRSYHWQTRGIQQTQIKWSTFFDLKSLSLHAPVMEWDDYVKKFEAEVDELYYLQRYQEGWKDGKWEEKMDFRPCIDDTRFYQNKDGTWSGPFWGYTDAVARKFQCVSIQADYAFLVPFLQKNTTGRCVGVFRAETVSHGRLSNWSPKYWTARRSTRFAKHLISLGDEFRREMLESNDEDDKTVLPPDWRNTKKQHGDAIGGPYIAVHMRRKDFLRSHKQNTPSLEHAAKQIEAACKKYSLDTVFVATDGTKQDFSKLKELLPVIKVVKYEPPQEVIETYLDGGVAIIDQWICAHARYFMGSEVSTFSFRIHEEREILGFKQEMTYNRFCGDESGSECEQPTKWEIKYDDDKDIFS